MSKRDRWLYYAVPRWKSSACVTIIFSESYEDRESSRLKEQLNGTVKLPLNGNLLSMIYVCQPSFTGSKYCRYTEKKKESREITSMNIFVLLPAVKRIIISVIWKGMVNYLVSSGVLPIYVEVYYKNILLLQVNDELKSFNILYF